MRIARHLGRLGGAGAAALLLAAACGGCAGPGGSFLAATSAEQFDAMLATADRPVMVAFYRNGCMACMFTAPTLNSLAKEYEGKLAFVKVERSVADVRRRYQVTGYPTVVLLLAGREYARWLGESGKGAYREILNRALVENRLGP